MCQRVPPPELAPLEGECADADGGRMEGPLQELVHCDEPQEVVLPGGVVGGERVGEKLASQKAIISAAGIPAPAPALLTHSSPRHPNFGEDGR